MKIKQAGFTLVEIMVVIVILGVIAAFALPSYERYVEKNAILNAKSAMAQLSQQMVKYLVNNNSIDAENDAIVAKSVSGIDNDKAKRDYTFSVANVSATNKSAYYIMANPINTKLPPLWMTQGGDAYKCKTFAEAKAQTTSGNCVKI